MAKGHYLAILIFLIIVISTTANGESTTSNNVKLTLVMKCGCADQNAAVLTDVRVIGQDGAGNSFDKTTDESGRAVIYGEPGTWQFTASKDGYVTSSWNMPVTEPDTKYPFLLNDNTAWKDKVDTTGPLSNEDLARLVMEKFPEGDVPGHLGESIRATAYAVAKAESYGGNPTTWGDRGLGDSIGLWQINLCQHQNYNALDLFDPRKNADAAFEISSGGTDWHYWSTWKYPVDAPKYKKYLKEGQDELDQLSGIKRAVTLTLYVHDGSQGGPIIQDATVTGHDGSGNNFQQTTDSNGYVTINGDSGTWSFSASASGYAINNWDQDITETETKQASLQKEQSPSENSVVGKWEVQGESECVSTNKIGYNGETETTSSKSTYHSIIDFHNDGSFSYTQLESQTQYLNNNGVWVEANPDNVNANKIYAGEWVQTRNTIHLQFNPYSITGESCGVDCLNDYQESEGKTYDGTINGGTMILTGSSLGHGRTYSKTDSSNSYSNTYDNSCSNRWTASRVDTGESASPSAGENGAQDEKTPLTTREKIIHGVTIGYPV